jgi:hypothetical protein
MLVSNVLREDDDSGVPLSEQGKEERMTLDRSEPSVVFGLVGLSYFATLLLLVFVVATAVLLF